MIRVALISSPERNSKDTEGQTRKGVAKQRIVSICKPMPFVIMGLDGNEKRLIGVNAETKIAIQSTILSNYFPNFQHLSGAVCNDAFEPNIEELIKLKPDLILQWKRLPETIAKMQSFGFNVKAMEYDGTEQNDRNSIKILASEINRTVKADSMMVCRDTIIRNHIAITKNIPFNKKPKVIFLYNYEMLRVGGEKSFENYCIELSGGRNMAAGLGVDRAVNIEQILEWNPDIIFIGGWRKNTNPIDIYQNQMLTEVNAIKNKRVFKMPVWSSNQSVLTWKWMAEILHPQLFNYKMQEEVRQWYAWEYHFKLSDAEINKILFRSENAISLEYNHLPL